MFIISEINSVVWGVEDAFLAAENLMLAACA
jgi:hypothetical protein